MVVACVTALTTPWARDARAAPPTATSPDTSAPEPEAAPEPAPEGFVAAELRETITIEYPATLLEAGRQGEGEIDPDAMDELPSGTVTIEFVVGTDGETFDAKIIEGVHPQIDMAALEAVSRLRYTPATYQGEPVEVVLSMQIEFSPPPPPARASDDGDPKPEGDATPTPKAQSDEGEDPAGPVGAGPIRVRGRVREAGQRGPLEGVRILVLPAPAGIEPGRIKQTLYDDETPAWTLATQSDAEGRYELGGVPVGLVRVVVLKEGFRRIEYVERVVDDGVLELEYFLPRLAENPFKTVVDVAGDEEDTAKRSISREEINNLPGTQGDALKAIQNFPGVARTPFGAGGLVIRGASPSDSQVFLGYHEIPNLFHFGALTSVFNSDILAQIDFIPGNFDSRFGDAIGGVVNVQPRRGRRDGFHGYIDSDLFDTGLMLEGPIGKGSFVLSGRRSYIDALLPALIPDDANLDFNVAPRYYDYQALLDYPVGDGELSIRIFGSDDRLSVIAPEENDDGADDNDSFGTVIGFHRADLVYRADKGPWSFLITPSYRHDVFTGSGGDIFDFKFNIDSFSGRAEVSRQLSSRAAIRVGTDMIAGRYLIEAQAPSFPTDNLGDRGDAVGAQINAKFARPSLYATSTIVLAPKFTLYPGLRLTYNALVFKRMAVDPRLRMRFDATDSLAIKGGVGAFSQVPDIFEFSSVWGNPAIGLERALHVSGGAEKKFVDIDLSVEVTGFYKYIWDLARPSRGLLLDESGNFVPERFASTGDGHIYGAEFLLRKDLSRRLFGWVSYTLSKSIDRPTPRDPFRPFVADQPHILTAIAVYKLPYNWQIGGRFRLVSGNPTTPVTDGVYDAKDGEYFPIEGAPNSGRLPTFHQLDLRVDKKWIFKYVLVNLYLDVQNVYNARNIETFNYSYNFQARNGVAGLPIIPSLGARLEF